MIAFMQTLTHTVSLWNVDACNLLGTKNVTVGRVSLFSLKEVRVLCLFQLLKSSAKEQSSELQGLNFHVCVRLIMTMNA